MLCRSIIDIVAFCVAPFALQIDALKMEGFVDSFIGALGLDRSYTMLVVNPKWSPSLPSYTYRIGFSEPELRLLHEQVRCGHALYHDGPWWQLSALVVWTSVVSRQYCHSFHWTPAAHQDGCKFNCCHRKPCVSCTLRSDRSQFCQ